MGWQDAPIVEAQKPAWASAPLVETQSAPRTGVEHAKDAAAVFLKHPFTAGVGVLENGVSGVTGGVGSLVEALTGKDPGSVDMAYRPRTEAGQEIAKLGEEEAAKVGEQYDKVAGTGPLAQTLKERLPQAAAAVGTVTGVAGGLKAFGRIPENGGIYPTGRVSSAVPGAAATEEAAAAARSTRLAPVSAESPSKADLKAAARAAYKRSEDAGAVIKPESFEAAKAAITDEQKGINPKLHPDATAALEEIQKQTGAVSLEQLETLRRIAQDAEASPKPPDAMRAGKLVDAIDEYADSLTEKDFASGSPEAVAAIKEARDYWKRARKADTLDELVRRAELSAPNFSGSGMENALRTEFRNLAKNERRMRQFSPEERAAIEKVAKGGPAENALRMLGKFAPTGLVSTIAGAAAGTAVGGPIGGVALPIAGGISRIAAKQMTMNNVARANQLVRRGPPISLTPQQALSKALVERTQ